ncbi:WD40-like domain containing protein [Bacteroides sp. GD17]|jgi:hypothetical protein|uniref:WD40-like domain containing protein n=1 Tax=Bacteroides sp. GD17 TaxID=3139826 RepID=UPI0025CD095B|nr:WD40-like domain containing protein [uncultured Bacteroides sp.]
MKKLQLFFLFALLLAACSDDDKEKQPTFVTNIAIVDADKTFDPGDAVTVKADGFQENDNLILNAYWPLPDEPVLNYKGSAKYIRAVIKERTATSITFLAPGGYPASRVEITLERSDPSHPMKLGQISVSDGLPPKEFQLYGITNYPPEANETNRIEQISLDKFAETTPKSIVQLPKGQQFSLVVNSPGSNTLCGILKQDGQYTTSCFDLSMRYWRSTAGTPVTLCNTYNNNIFEISQIDETHLTVNNITSSSYSRSLSPAPQPRFELPEGLKADALRNYRGICLSEGYILLSADNGDGTFSPAIMDLRSGKYSIHLYDPIQCDALIPFWIAVPKEGTNEGTYTGGYAISNANGGDTEFRLWNTTTMSMDEQLDTFPNPVRSITTFCTGDLGTQKLYVLFEAYRNGWLIEAYDLTKKEWQSLGFGYPYAEIVLAR